MLKKNWFYIALIATFAGSGVAHYAHADSTVQFILAGIAIIFVAGFLGKATESVAHYAGDRLGGFLNATFGNAAELIIALILIKDAVGEGNTALFDTVKASITGSIIGNLLLVLGLSVLAGGIKFKTQQYNVRMATHSGSLMLLAVIALFIPAMFASNMNHEHLTTLSLTVSIILIVAYFLWLFFSMVTHKKELAEEAVEHGEAQWSLRTSIFYLVLATVMVAMVSEWMVGTLEEISHRFGLSELFIGAFVIAIVGNAAEHSAAVMLAMKNKIGAAVEIAIGSSLQIALFVAPVLVIASALMGQTMDIVFTLHELAAIGVAVFIASSVSRDGDTNWYEGVLLLTVYIILGFAFFLLN